MNEGRWRGRCGSWRVRGWSQWRRWQRGCRLVSACACLVFFFLLGPRGQCHPHSEWVVPLQLALSGSTLTEARPEVLLAPDSPGIDTVSHQDLSHCLRRTPEVRVCPLQPTLPSTRSPLMFWGGGSQREWQRLLSLSLDSRCHLLRKKCCLRQFSLRPCFARGLPSSLLATCGC